MWVRSTRNAKHKIYVIVGQPIINYITLIKIVLSKFVDQFFNDFFVCYSIFQVVMIRIRMYPMCHN